MIRKQATLRDISNVGANLIIRREDDDDGAEVIYGEAYILQRQVDGEWQDAETVPDNYGFPMVGYNVPGGEEASIYYNWEWLYGALENIEWSGMSQEKTAVRQAHRHTGSIYVFDFREGKS